jgi:Flp pilus assembly protein TadB
MALSEHEQRLLEEMERNLLQEDATLDQKLKHVGSVNRGAGKLVAGVLTMIAGVGLLIFAVATQVTFMGVVAFIVMVIGLVVASSNFRLPELPNTKFRGGGGSFFEDRWNNRFNND